MQRNNADAPAANDAVAQEPSGGDQDEPPPPAATSAGAIVIRWVGNGARIEGLVPDALQPADTIDVQLCLLQNAARRRWRDVQNIRRALATFPDRQAPLGELIQAVAKVDPTLKYTRLWALLRRPNGHFARRDDKYRYQHGGPELSKPEAENTTWMLRIRDGLTELGGRASPLEIVDWMQRNFPADEMPADRLRNYLVKGPFVMDCLGRWRFTPGSRGSDGRRGKSFAETLDLRTIGYDPSTLGLPKIPTDPEGWLRMCLSPEAMRKYLRGLAVARAIEELGDKARPKYILAALIERHGRWLVGSLNSMLHRDPHFQRRPGTRRWTYKPGPPALMKKQLGVWYRRRIAIETLEALGGQARSHHIVQATQERMHPEKPTKWLIRKNLVDGPFGYTKATRLWRYLPDEAEAAHEARVEEARRSLAGEA